ncbi:MAG: wax ester/triacylglycerol synthase family O-acyltransferase [Pseudomonadota bacterium]
MLQQLSTLDASFAFMETKASPMHIGSLYVYDRGGKHASGLTEDEVLRFYEERLHLWSFSRQRLVRVPMDLDYPYWIEDAEFDLEYHVRRIGLPSPGDWATLEQVAARIFSRPLDLTRPLWEVYVIEGVRAPGIVNDGFAVLTKTHHAAVDGTSGMHMMATLHSSEPKADPIPAPERPWRPDATPSDAELLMRSGVNNAMQPLRFAQALGRNLQGIAAGLGASGGQVGMLGGLARAGSQVGEQVGKLTAQTMRVVPATRFNGEVSGHRVIGGHTVALSDFKGPRAAVPGATVNDVVLTICGGAIGRYLYAKKELPGDPLIAMAPVNVRRPGDMRAGNQVSALFVAIGTQIADPLERLAGIRSATATSKAVNNAVGARAMTDFSQFVPAVTAALAGRLSSAMAQAPNPAFNVSITNVPGPQEPIYSMGCELKAQLGLGPITHGMGLIMPVTSYCGQITIGFTSCRDMIPDPDLFVDCLADAAAELFSASARALEASGAADAAGAASKPKPKAKTKRKTKATAKDKTATKTEAKAKAKTKTKAKSKAKAKAKPAAAAMTGADEASVAEVPPMVPVAGQGEAGGDS